MRDPARIPRLLALVERIWRRYPDLRLGQIIVNALPDRFENDPFFIEDSDLEAALIARYEVNPA